MTQLRQALDAMRVSYPSDATEFAFADALSLISAAARSWLSLQEADETQRVWQCEDCRTVNVRNNLHYTLETDERPHHMRPMLLIPLAAIVGEET